jgi:hypothetical protein
MTEETDTERQARTGLSSLRISDEESQKVQKTPNRISLDSMVAEIDQELFISPSIIPHMTLCVIVLKNGFALVGKSAPADAGNYDKELGRKFAKEDAIRQAWPLFAFSLRDKLHKGEPA